MTNLSANTQAILLLTAHLIVGKKGADSEALSLGEYNRLAQRLKEVGAEPSDLLLTDTAAGLRDYESVVDVERLQRLLARGFQLSQAVEYWQTRAIWVVSRPDREYPRRLKTRLGGRAPAVLFGCGDPSLLEQGGLAVVGSRNVDEQLFDYSLSIGRLAAQADRSVISGGAKGVDQAAMMGALEAGGRVCGVLSDSLEKQAMVRDHRRMLMEGHLTLVSPYDPKAAFHVGNAMQRNKLIYALADASLVVSSDLDKGGTWTGAVEQLEKLKLGPLYVRSTGDVSPGLRALLQRGARAWPNPDTPEALEETLSATVAAPQGDRALFSSDAQPEQTPTALALPSEVAQNIDTEGIPADPDNQPAHSPADRLFMLVQELILQFVDAKAMKDGDIADRLGVSGTQAKQWLARMMEEGQLERSSRPAVYRRKERRLF